MHGALRVRRVAMRACGDARVRSAHDARLHSPAADDTLSSAPRHPSQGSKPIINWRPARHMSRPHTGCHWQQQPTALGLRVWFGARAHAAKRAVRLPQLGPQTLALLPPWQQRLRRRRARRPTRTCRRAGAAARAPGAAAPSPGTARCRRACGSIAARGSGGERAGLATFRGVPCVAPGCCCSGSRGLQHCLGTKAALSTACLAPLQAAVSTFGASPPWGAHELSAAFEWHTLPRDAHAHTCKKRVHVAHRLTSAQAVRV
jgi:hypothetical protein